jgi:hypothetical protein
MPQKVKNKITSQCIYMSVYYLQSILSVLLPRCYPPPSFLLLSFSSAALLSSPFPLLSYPLVAIAIAVAAVACSA